MTRTDVFLLDVGHGNGAVLTDGGEACVVDAPKNATMLEALSQLGVSHVTAVVASHSDADHIGGLINLISNRQIRIGMVYANPDSEQASESWLDFKFALRDARRREGTRHSAITSDLDRLRFGSLVVDVLAPAPELFLSSSGGLDLNGRRVRSNTMSVVLRIRSGGTGVALLPGDLDATGLANLLEGGCDLSARTLVFPHHGGRPANGSPTAFAKNLCRAVKPDLVFFSIGRGRHSTPRPDIVAAVMEERPAAYIACSQLSTRCAASNPTVPREHLALLPANGKYFNTCCIGSLRLLDSRSLASVKTGHASFVDAHAPTALCRLPSN